MLLFNYQSTAIQYRSSLRIARKIGNILRFRIPLYRYSNICYCMQSSSNMDWLLKGGLGGPNQTPKYHKVNLKTQIVRLLHDLQKRGGTCCLKCSDYHTEAATSVGIYIRSLGKDLESLQNNGHQIIGTGKLPRETSPYDPRVSEHEFYFLQCIDSQKLEEVLSQIR